MKLFYKDYQPSCKIPEVEGYVQTLLAGTKYVIVSVQIEDGTIINVPGKFLYSETTKTLIPEDKEKIDEFLKSR